MSNKQQSAQKLATTPGVVKFITSLDPWILMSKYLKNVTVYSLISQFSGYCIRKDKFTINSELLMKEKPWLINDKLPLSIDPFRLF